eukprot:c5004_g1_i1.p1 GENE.c5004_g1_i1~~c5004_g1_i1.p1  ORF type:complete len:227 (-),score=41.56 c5004_g1_i1:34-714(-)
MTTQHHHPSKESSVSPQLFQYLLDHSVRDTPVLHKCRAETQQMTESRMQISPDEGQFLMFLAKAIGAKRAIEVGVFTGYSSLCVASALPEDGLLVALDVSEEFTNKAKTYWEEAKVAHKIDLRLGPAIESLTQMINNGESGTYDLAFLDADKANYDLYFELCLQLIRPGGVITIDNVLWSGKVLNPEIQDADTVAIRNLNEKLHKDERITLSMLAMGDGVTLCFKN